MQNRRNQLGTALIMVLMIVAVMTVVATSMLHGNKLLVQEAAMLKQYSQAQRDVKSVKASLLRVFLSTSIWSKGAIQSEKEKHKLPAELNLYGDVFDYMESQVQIQSEAGLISLIPFDRDAMRGVMRHLEVEEKQINIVIDSIADWMDGDDFVRLNGAEKLFYSTPGLPRNSDIQTLNELRLIRGVTPEIWEKISPYITLFGYTINPRYSPSTIAGYNYSKSVQDKIKKSRSYSGGDTSIDLSDVYSESGQYPGDKLRFTIKMEYELASYSESFTIVRTTEQIKPFIITDVVVGKL